MAEPPFSSTTSPRYLLPLPRFILHPHHLSASPCYPRSTPRPLPFSPASPTTGYAVAGKPSASSRLHRTRRRARRGGDRGVQGGSPASSCTRSREGEAPEPPDRRQGRAQTLVSGSSASSPIHCASSRSNRTDALTVSGPTSLTPPFSPPSPVLAVSFFEHPLRAAARFCPLTPAPHSTLSRPRLPP